MGGGSYFAFEGVEMMKQNEERFPLRNVSEPELYRDIFPYSQIPSVGFEGTPVPRSIPAEA